MRKKKITFIITALGIGGAEMMLLRLIRNLNKDVFDLHVITLKSGGVLESEISKLGIPLYSAEMNTFSGLLKSFFILRQVLCDIKPDVVFCWMYHANLFGGLVAKSCGIQKIFWNIRNSGLKSFWKTPLTSTVIKVSAFLSGIVPEQIIVNSYSSCENHIRIGYSKSKMRVIHNGIDIQEFMPNPESRQIMNKTMHAAPTDFLVGMAARFHPQKDHLTLIKAAYSVRAAMPNVRFILCGTGIDSHNEKLVSWIKKYGLGEYFDLLGERRDMPRVMGAWDLSVLSSAYGESFPNVVGESMSCEIPVVATDVGDSALIVGDAGLIVPPGDHQAFAEAILKLLGNTDLRNDMGKNARRRILENYSIEKATHEYELLLTE